MGQYTFALFAYYKVAFFAIWDHMISFFGYLLLLTVSEYVRRAICTEGNKNVIFE